MIGEKTFKKKEKRNSSNLKSITNYLQTQFYAQNPFYNQNIHPFNCIPYLTMLNFNVQSLETHNNNSINNNNMVTQHMNTVVTMTNTNNNNNNQTIKKEKKKENINRIK